MNILRLCAFVLISGGLAISQPATADAVTDYPKRPVKLIVPYPPGGPTDIVGRLVAHQLTEKLGQSVLVENIGGANGNIGSSQAARATPDGYTLLLGSSGPLTVNPGLYPKMGFKPDADLTPIAVVAELPLILVTGPSMKVRTFAEFLVQAKAQPGKLTFASSGSGSTQHLAGELFKSVANLDMRHIPYKGAAPAMTDLLAGRVDFMIELSPTALPQIASGRLRPLAVTTTRRLAALTDTPTFQESGFPNYEVTSWFGIMAPAGTPKPIVERLHADLTAISRGTAFRARLAAAGVQPLESTLPEFERRISTDIAKWGQVIKQANVQID